MIQRWAAKIRQIDLIIIRQIRRQGRVLIALSRHVTRRVCCRNGIIIPRAVINTVVQVLGGSDALNE